MSPAVGDHAQNRAVVYASHRALCEAIVPAMRAGVEHGDRVLAALLPERFDEVRAELGVAGFAVEAAGPTILERSVGAAFAGLQRYLAAHAVPGRGRVLVVSEQPRRLERRWELRHVMRYEAAANVLLRPFDAVMLCLYDAQAVPPAALAEVERTHPLFVEGMSLRQSPTFMDPLEYLCLDDDGTGPPSGAPSYGYSELSDLGAVRAFVRRQAGPVAEHSARLGAQSLEDLLLAVSEIAANALVHGEAPRWVRTYEADGAFVCRLHEGGPGVSDPLAGFGLPSEAGIGGRGLWIAHQLCDGVATVRAGDGSDVCLYADL